jgi:hypothetical protein
MNRSLSLPEVGERLARLAGEPSALDSRTAARIVGGSLALGLLADALFFDVAGAGINLTMWVAAWIVAYLYSTFGRARRPAAHQYVLLAIAFVFAACVAWRGSPSLIALDAVAVFGCLTLAVALPTGASLRRVSPMDLAVTGTGALIGLVAGLPRVAMDSGWSRKLGVRSRENTLVAGRAVILTVPLLAGFGGLFVAADAVFQSGVEHVLGFDMAGLWEHAFWVVGAAWFACGLLWLGLVVDVPGGAKAELPQEKRLKWMETAIVLGALAALFAAFVAVQVRYLFGGESLVEETIGLTYAEYARRGFFELVAAAALLLPVLLAFDWARRRDERSSLTYRVLAALLVLLLAVVMASALQRMRVYMDAFGLTQLRLYVVTFLVCLGAVFAWFSWTVLRGRRNEFMLGAGAAAVLGLLALNVMNPDALIARTNTSRLADGREFDAYHASQLGPEAAPVLVERLNRLETGDACLVSKALLADWAQGQEDLRSWNLGRDRAREAVRGHLAKLEAACGAATAR